MENQDRGRDRAKEQPSERREPTQRAADHLLWAALVVLNRKDDAEGTGTESRPDALVHVRRALASLGYEAAIRPVGSTEPFAPVPPAPEDEPIPAGKEPFYRRLRETGMTHAGALDHLARLSGQNPPRRHEVNEAFRTRLLSAGFTPEQADAHMRRVAPASAPSSRTSR